MKQTFLALASICTLSLSAIGADENKADADNTKRNERDRSGETKTSGDQSNSPEDLTTTKMIRRALMEDDSLSMTAKNIKVITAGGKVTLRGPVNSNEEKEKVAKLAQSAAGGATIENQLEVKMSH